MRRLGKGRLSEIFGKESVPIDEFLRSIELNKACEETWERGVEDSYKEVLIAFSNGINDYVKGVSLTPIE